MSINMNEIGEVSNGVAATAGTHEHAAVENVMQEQQSGKRRKRKKKIVTKTNNTGNNDDASKQTLFLKEQLFATEKLKMETNTSSLSSDQSSSSRSESSTTVTSDVAPSNSSSTNTESSLPQELNLNIVQKMWLEVNNIFPLKKKNPKHPSALYFCKLCTYYCMSYAHCKEHVEEPKHCRNQEEHAQMTTLTHLPTPTKHHTDVLTDMLTKFSSIFGLSDEEKETREKFASRIDAFISGHLPGCGVRLYGSSVTGFGLKCSNVNLDFHVASTLSAPTMLKAAYNLLHGSCDFVKCVNRDFHDEIPSVFFFDETNLMRCVLSLNSHEAHKTSELLASYQPLDPRVKILGTCFRLWAKTCKIDDHLMGLLPAYSYNLLLIYFLQQVQPPVLTVLKESNSETHWTSANTMSIGELWLKLFRFYAIDHPNSENVVCIRSKELVKRIDKHWTGKKIAIEDPYLRKRNVSRYIVNHASHDFIQECLRHSYKYFAIPQTEFGALFSQVIMPMEEYRQIPDVDRNIRKSEQMLISTMDNDPRFIKLADTELSPAVTAPNMISVSELEEKLRESSIQNSGDQDPNSSVVKSLPPELPTIQTKPVNYRFYSTIKASPKMAELLCFRLKKEFHCFKMDGDAFTLGRAPPVVCIICQQRGHIRTHCPDNHFPPLQPLPPMQDFFIKQLNDVCLRIFDTWSPTMQEIEERQNIVNDLEAYLRVRYPAVKLELFGSSCNGFGFHRSDLDICLTFMDNKAGGDINYVLLIEELVRYLKAYGKLTNLIPITTAKVPIVKFTYPKYKVDCDISLYNTLAQRNTHMLRTYAQIDRRVQILGFTMKRFAKLCDICDASRGSLSSYAYILMVLYFLQQCNPPVIPVLQQLYTTEEKPQDVVENWNTWFYDDLNNLSKVWLEYGRNTASPGQLWTQLLRFYTEEFDFNEYVVCIRQKEKLLRFEKLWNSKCMAIEDPFDLTHNLGSGLSRKMNNFIIKAFRNGRMHFGIPMSRLPAPYKDLMEYLFEAKFLCDGQPPNDRGCRICKKIGHICKDCPQRKGNKKRQVEKRTTDKAARNAPPVANKEEQTNNPRAPTLRGLESSQQADSARPINQHPRQALNPLLPTPPSQHNHHHQQQQQQQKQQVQQQLHIGWNTRTNGIGIQQHQAKPTAQELLLNAVGGGTPQPNNWWPASNPQGQSSPQRGNLSTVMLSNLVAMNTAANMMSQHSSKTTQSMSSQGNISRTVASSDLCHKSQLTVMPISKEHQTKEPTEHSGKQEVSCKLQHQGVPLYSSNVMGPSKVVENLPANKTYLDATKVGQPLINYFYQPPGSMPSLQYYPMPSTTNYNVPMNQGLPPNQIPEQGSASSSHTGFILQGNPNSQHLNIPPPGFSQLLPAPHIHPAHVFHRVPYHPGHKNITEHPSLSSSKGGAFSANAENSLLNTVMMSSTSANTVPVHAPPLPATTHSLLPQPTPHYLWSSVTPMPNRDGPSNPMQGRGPHIPLTQVHPSILPLVPADIGDPSHLMCGSDNSVHKC